MSEKQFNLDTVEHAAATPDTELPWAELGLKENEFEDIKEILGRRPTAAELGNVLGHVVRALLLQVF